jgi:DNA-binding transcriptional ArsR family regulator
MQENRRLLNDPAVLDALAHPVRLDVLDYLMAAGPATASVCARAVGDSPSNCSYHLRVLARLGLVEQESSADGRERPWRATITGFDTTPDAENPDSDAAADAMAGASLQLNHQLAREHLRTRHTLPEEWRQLDAHITYGLSVTPAELRSIVDAIDAIVRPFIGATRDHSPDGAETAHLSITAFPRPHFR